MLAPASYSARTASRPSRERNSSEALHNLAERVALMGLSAATTSGVLAAFGMLHWRLGLALLAGGSAAIMLTVLELMPPESDGR
jgi:hypothetical protein